MAVVRSYGGLLLAAADGYSRCAPEVLDAECARYDERCDVFSFAIGARISSLMRCHSRVRLYLVCAELWSRALPYSEYSEFVLRQEVPLTETDLQDAALLARLQREGVLVDMQRLVVMAVLSATAN